MDSDSSLHDDELRSESPSSSSVAAFSPVPFFGLLSPIYYPNTPTYVLTSPDYSSRSPSYSPAPSSPIYTPYDSGSPATIVLNSDDSDYVSSEPDYEPNSPGSRLNMVFSPSPEHLYAIQDTVYAPRHWSLDSLSSLSQLDHTRRYTPSIESVVRPSSTNDSSINGLKARVLELEEENEKLKKDFTCIICLTEKRNAILLPCCHFNTCEGCATKLENCAVCRCEIRGKLKIFEN